MRQAAATTGSKTPGSSIRLLLMLATVAVAGCSTTGSNDNDDELQEVVAATGTTPVSFSVKVVSENRGVANFLEDNLELQRYAGFADLQLNELDRLLAETEANARDLLAARGYFQPQLQLRAEVARAGSADRRITIEVDPGQRARIASVQIAFAEPMNSDPAAEAQREAIRRDWLLPVGNTFSQAEWDAAKSAGLHTLQEFRYPAARIGASEATVLAETGRVELQITYDAGAAYRFGELALKEVERYDAEGIANIARIPTGADYSEDALLGAQQRLSSSGYFRSSFLLLDAESDPQNATVVAQLREAKYNQIVFGPGYSTDTGPRLTIDHTHNKLWPLGWRAQNKLTVGTQAQSFSTHWTDLPKPSGWAWFTGVALERADYGDFRTHAMSLTGGQTRSLDHSDHRYFVQYDASRSRGIDAPDASSSLLANYAWTARHFDNRTNPTSGFGLGADAGFGFAITPRGDPFTRVLLRGLQLLPFGGRNIAGRRSRIALRAETGAVMSKGGVDVPVTLLFLTGGDTTVRGYSYQSIGSQQDDGSVFGARYMALASAEWQHPITLFGDAGSWEHTLFVDTGSATDDLHAAEWFTGVGAGLRWRSPVGPLQLDVAYGTKVDKWRLHLRMGFQF